MVHKGREEPWPFIIPLPTKSTAQYRILTSVFSSDIAMKILRRLKLNAKTYQRDLVAELKAHSNKSILKYLKMFVEAGILEEGMERVTEDGRSMWIKWYMPTFMGKWLILLLTPRESLSPEEIKSVIEDLLSFYAKSIAKLCSNYNIDPDYFKRVFEEALTEKEIQV